MLTRSFAIVAYRVAARVGRDRKRKRLVARWGTGGRRGRRRRSRSLDLSLVDSLGKVARTENNERKKRPCVLSVSLSRRRRRRRPLNGRHSGELGLVDSGAPGVDALKRHVRDEEGILSILEPPSSSSSSTISGRSVRRATPRRCTAPSHERGREGEDEEGDGDGERRIFF